MNNDTIATQKKQLLGVANAALEHWELNGRLSLIKYRENAVYRLDTVCGQRFALRVHRRDYHSNGALNSELTWAQSLRQAGLQVPLAVPTCAGAPFASITYGPGTPWQVDLLEWVTGAQIGSCEEGLGDDSEAIANAYRTIGEIAARIHNHSEEWNRPASFQRHSWDLDGLVGEQPMWGRFWELECLTPEQRALILEARDRASSDLRNLGQGAGDYGLIHADLVPENVLSDGARIQVIDFDDAGFGWYLFELATALYFIQGDTHFALARDALIEGYRRQRSLGDDKLAWLPLFMVVRSFTYLGWVHTRQGTETAKDLTPTLVSMCCDTVKSYLKRN